MNQTKKAQTQGEKREKDTHTHLLPKTVHPNPLNSPIKWKGNLREWHLMYPGRGVPRVAGIGWMQSSEQRWKWRGFDSYVHWINIHKNEKETKLAPRNSRLIQR